MGDAVGESLAEGAAAELAAVIGEHALEPPAGGLELAGNAAGERRGLRERRPRGPTDDQVGPGVRAVAVDGGDLPDRAGGSVQAADEEAVHAHELAGSLRLDVRLRLRLAGRLGGRAVAGDQGQSLPAGVEPVPNERLVDAVGRHEDAAPLASAELGCDPPWAEARMAEREGDDPLLDERRELVGHLRPSSLARSQHLQPGPLDLLLPAVVGRVMDTHRAASGTNADLAREREQAQR